MDIKPPKGWQRPRPAVASPRPSVHPAVRPTIPVSPKPEQTTSSQAVEPFLPESPDMTTPATPATPLQLPTVSRTRRRWVRRTIVAVCGILLLSALAAVMWFFWAISPRSASEVKQQFNVVTGETPTIISTHLEEQGLIRSRVAFDLYTKLHGVANKLQAGSYKLAPNQSVENIVAVLLKGQDTVYNVMIPPGMTLKQLADPTVKGSFAAQGFSATEIAEAFSATYTSPLLKDKPVDASLEGYIFPETFQAKEGDSLKSILERSFDELYSRIEKDGLLQKFSSEGLTLHQALTLGSIVQKEVSDASVQPQVAQVFLSRMKNGMTLGSDVTFIYAARQLGVAADPSLESPYNTRIHTGLPPGPIATMNYSALQAVASPAAGDYLFFVAGDDGTVHFSRSNVEHEQQVQQYCHTLCTMPL